MADASGDLGVRLQGNGVDHQVLAFPMADRVAVEGEIRVIHVRAAIGEDATHLAVGLDGDGHPARREDELQRIGHLHDLGRARRDAVGVLVLDVLAVFLGGLVGVELGLHLGRQGGRLGTAAGPEQGRPVDLPDAFFPIRQLAQRGIGRDPLLRALDRGLGLGVSRSGRGVARARRGGGQRQHGDQGDPLDLDLHISSRQDGLFLWCSRLLRPQWRCGNRMEGGQRHFV